jgi:FkbM family methyltransferase
VFVSYAQNCEDVVLWRALQHIESGRYVDVGAAHPVDDSVTKAFYDRGWSGIDIEPTVAFAEALRSARQRDRVVQACVGDVEGSVTLHEVRGTGLSTVGEAEGRPDLEAYEVVDVEVPMVRLDDVLEGEGLDGCDIHFLKVDVEGFEENVLRGTDLSRWRPWVVVVESTAPNSTVQVHERWEHLLVGAGYRFCLFDGLNRFYVSPDHSELEELLSFPACFFDEPFLRRPHAELLDEFDNLAAGNRNLQEAYGQAIEDNGHLDEVSRRALADFERLGETYRQSIDDYLRMETAHRSTVADYERLERLYHQTIADYERLEHSYHRAIADYERVNEERLHDRLHLEGELSLLRDECSVLREGVARMSAEYDELRAARDRANHELDLMRQTVSWRVTRPLRGVRRRLSR